MCETTVPVNEPVTFTVPLSEPLPLKSVSCVTEPFAEKRTSIIRVAIGSVPRGSRM